MSDADLPEGVIDADPPGGWSDGATADAETAEQSRQAEDSPGLTTAAHDAASEDAAAWAGVGEVPAGAGAVPDDPVAPDAPVESARLEAEMDADLSNEEPEDVDDEENR